MPCIWGKHDLSQAFLNVAIFDAGVIDRESPSGIGDRITMHVFSAIIDTGSQSTCITGAAAEKVGLVPVGKVPIRRPTWSTDPGALVAFHPREPVVQEAVFPMPKGDRRMSSHGFSLNSV